MQRLFERAVRSTMPTCQLLVLLLSLRRLTCAAHRSCSTLSSLARRCSDRNSTRPPLDTSRAARAASAAFAAAASSRALCARASACAEASARQKDVRAQNCKF